jgi:hypothetical protein
MPDSGAQAKELGASQGEAAACRERKDGSSPSTRGSWNMPAVLKGKRLKEGVRRGGGGSHES